MLLIISGTNRDSSKSLEMARHYKKVLANKFDVHAELLDLAEIQENMLHAEMYESDGQGDSIRRAQEKYFIPASKWIIISPEYNGSYPGALKLMIDALSVREADLTFKNKKVALVGISSGRAGNWLGMNHLTSILNYLKMNVFYNKLAIRNISAVLNDKNELADSKTRLFIEKQMEDFLSF